LVAFAALLLLNLPAGPAARLRLAISSQFLPFFGLADGVQDMAGAAADLALSKRELVRQNNLLRAEIQQLKIQGAQATEVSREAVRVAQMLGWQRQEPWRMKLARVVVRDPANWWRTVQIDLGSRDGVRINAVVLTPDGLVGRVAAVGFTRSEVVLVGDPNCRVAAVVDDESRDTGVISSAYPLDRTLVQFGFLSRTATLKPGQRVLSSGQGGIFPRGIPVGTIVDTRPVDYGLSMEARVKLLVDMGTLEEVWVLTL
jgi:rod shape-determining protein MreC